MEPSVEHQPEELRTNARLLSLIYDCTSDPVYLVLVEAMGGSVNMESTVGAGSKFTVELPLRLTPG